MLLLTVAAVVAGGIASVAGFGIGSVLTPLLAAAVGTKAAVAAVSVPHVVATLLRFLLLRKHLDRRVLLHFGVLSAAGGLGGALLHSYASTPVLAGLLAALLIFGGISGIVGLSGKLKFRRYWAWIAGAVSGTLGGLVGNQGGVRTAALLGFGIPRNALVATATGTALLVDAARMPVYFALEFEELRRLGPEIALMTAGVIVGTVFGARVLQRIPERVFQVIVGVLLLGLGLYLAITVAEAGQV